MSSGATKTTHNDKGNSSVDSFWPKPASFFAQSKEVKNIIDHLLGAATHFVCDINTQSYADQHFRDANMGIHLSRVHSNSAFVNRSHVSPLLNMRRAR